MVRATELPDPSYARHYIVEYLEQVAAGNPTQRGIVNHTISFMSDSVDRIIDARANADYVHAFCGISNRLYRGAWSGKELHGTVRVLGIEIADPDLKSERAAILAAELKELKRITTR